MAFVLAAAVLVFVPGAGRVEAPPFPKDIIEAIRDLGHEQFTVRQKASQHLRTRWQVSEAALRIARKSPDLEIARLAEQIFEEFKWGITPETPKEYLPVIATYRGGDAKVKATVLDQLIAKGPSGYRVAGKLLATEAKKERQALWEALHKKVEPVRLQLLLTGKDGDLESLLEMAMAGGRNQDVRDYAVFLLLTGRITSALEHWHLLSGGKRAGSAQPLRAAPPSDPDVRN
jgi:hypothetical protein